MSLITSRTSGSTTSSYFIKNAGTDSAPVISTDDAGTVRVDASTAGAAFIQGTGSSLTLGANGTAFNMLALNTVPSAAVQANVPVLCASSFGVAGPAVFQTSISLEGQQIQNNLRYTQAFGPVADGTNNGALGSAQPALLAGSYAIYAQVIGAPQIQPSAIGNWNGTQWSAGANGTAHSFPGGGAVLNFRPDPATAGANLCMSNASGGPVSGFIYYTALGEN